MTSHTSREPEPQVAATRRSHRVLAGRRVRRIRVLAFAGIGTAALALTLVVASTAGVPTVVSPLLPERLGAARPTPSVAPSPSVSPSPTTDPTVPAMDVDGTTDASVPTTPPTTEPVVVTPAPAPPAPAPSEPGTDPAEDDRGNSAAAPGRTKAPKPPASP